MKLRAGCQLQQACSSRESGWASHACWPVNRRAEEWLAKGGHKRKGKGEEEAKTKRKRKQEEEEGSSGEEEKRSKGKNIFFREVREESARFDYLLLDFILFFRITLHFLLIFRWLLWLPKEANLFLTFVYLIFVFSRMSCMLDIFCVCVLSSLRSSHQALLKALLVFVTQNLVLVVLSSLIHYSVLLLFSVLSFFSSLFPSILGIFWKGDSLAWGRSKVANCLGIFLQSERRRAFQFSWCLAGDIWKEEILSRSAMLQRKGWIH